MLKNISCKKMIYNPSVSTISSIVQAQMQENGSLIDLILLPDLYSIFPSLNTSREDGELFPYPYDFSLSGPDEVVLYLHSSGSTGSPKSIPQTHRTVLQWANARECCVA